MARSPANWALPLPRRAEDAGNLPPSAIKVVREDMHEDVAEGDKGGGPNGSGELFFTLFRSYQDVINRASHRPFGWHKPYLSSRIRGRGICPWATILVDRI